jgi:hypothetical protein
MGQVPRDDNNIPLVGVASTGYAAAGTNLANTTGGADYVFTWTRAVNHIMIQNNTAANAQWELDVVTSGGSPILTPGQTIFLDVQTTALHLLTASNQNVNGASGNNIVVRGWL